MITLKHNNGLPIETTTVKVPTIYVARHSNATDIIYFETVEEYETYKSVHFPKQEETSEE